jgi:hypothetical protein
MGCDMEFPKLIEQDDRGRRGPLRGRCRGAAGKTSYPSRSPRA